MVAISRLNFVNISKIVPLFLSVSARLFFHAERARLIMSIDSVLSAMALKPEAKNTVTSHEQPVTCARFLDQNQVSFPHKTRKVVDQV